MNNVCAVYKITNTITGDFYIGSSKDIKHRWTDHKCPSRWNDNPNNPMYLDMKKYGVDKFAFEILEEVEVEKLKEKEQQFIEALKPTYNNYNAKGLDVERQKKTKKKCQQSDKCKEYQKKYRQSDKCKQYQKEYYNQLCCYNGETLTLSALKGRFMRKGIDHPVLEAKKYLISEIEIEK